MTSCNPKIDSIAITHDSGFLVWSKPNAYDLHAYDEFTRDAAAHIVGMLRNGGCHSSLRVRTEQETCDQGVFCVRVVIRRAA